MTSIPSSRFTSILSNHTATVLKPTFGGSVQLENAADIDRFDRVLGNMLNDYSPHSPEVRLIRKSHMEELAELLQACQSIPFEHMPVIVSPDEIGIRVDNGLVFLTALEALALMESGKMPETALWLINSYPESAEQFIIDFLDSGKQIQFGYKGSKVYALNKEHFTVFEKAKENLKDRPKELFAKFFQIAASANPFNC